MIYFYIDLMFFKKIILILILCWIWPRLILNSRIKNQIELYEESSFGPIDVVLFIKLSPNLLAFGCQFCYYDFFSLNDIKKWRSRKRIQIIFTTIFTYLQNIILKNIENDEGSNHADKISNWRTLINFFFFSLPCSLDC